MEKKHRSDRISDLPGNVIDNILACLPLKDAVRTCSLSSKWKAKWHTLPQIIVKEDQFSSDQKYQMEGIISYILNQHEGHVHKFYISGIRLEVLYNLKSWLWSLSKKGIQDLTLMTTYRSRHNDNEEVPCDLFSCLQLRNLKLQYFKFKSPRTFRGFHHLVSLELTDIGIKTNTLESLVGSCLLLERLVLKDLTCADHLHINALNLSFFSFDGEFKSICFNSPRLEVMSLNLYRLRSGKTKHFDVRSIIQGIPPSLQELHVRCPFNKFLAAVDRLTEDSTSYTHLKTLDLYEFCFKQADELSCLLALLEGFPNLQCLNMASCKCMKDSGPATKFWEEEINLPYLNQLESMEMRSFNGEGTELKFIEFILAHSVVLKDMTIHAKRSYVDEVVKAQLMTLPRLSGKVEIKFVAQRDDSESDGSYFSGSD